MAKIRTIAVASVLIAVSLAVWRRINHTPPPARSHAETLTNSARIAKVVATNAAAFSLPVTMNESETMHARAVAAMLRFASAAKLSNMDETITLFVDQTNKLDGKIQSTTIATPTHTVEFMPRTDREVVYVHAHWDSSRSPKGQERWYQYIGTWTEAEAFAETRAILQRLGEGEILPRIAKQTYEATSMKLPTPDGQSITVTPFATVTLYDKNGQFFLSAEFRLTSSGPDLVRWFYWP